MQYISTRDGAARFTASQAITQGLASDGGLLTPFYIPKLPGKALEDLTQETKAYEKEGDCALYADRPTTYVTLQPGQFLIVYPEDPHAPIIGEGKIRKLIGKVKVDFTL